MTISGWWFGTFGLLSISYMGCHPNPIDELLFFKMVFAPPTRMFWGRDLMVRSSEGYDMTQNKKS